VSAQHPDKLKELQAAFMEEAIKYNVLPLDDRARSDSSSGRMSLHRPSEHVSGPSDDGSPAQNAVVPGEAEDATRLATST
jgi:hypothetical protein